MSLKVRPFIFACYWVLLAAFALPSQVLSQELEEFEEDSFFTDPLTRFKDLPKQYSQSVKRTVLRSTYEGIDQDGKIDYTAQLFLNRMGHMSGLPAIHFNRVDGLVLGIQSELQQFVSSNSSLAGFDLAGSLSYAFGQDRWLWQLAAEKNIANEVLIGAEWHDFTTSSDLWRAGAIESSVTAFFTGFDYLNYYSAKGFSAYATTKARIIQFSVGYHWNRFSSLDLQTRYSMFGGKSVVRDNPEITEGSYQSFSGVVNLNPTSKWISPWLLIQGSFYAEIGDHEQLSLADLATNRYMGNTKISLQLDKTTQLQWRGIAHATTSSNGAVPTQFLASGGGFGSVMSHPLGSLAGTHMLVSNLELSSGYGRVISVDSKNDPYHKREVEWDDIEWDIDFNSPQLGVFWDMGWAGFASNESTTNPIGGFQNNRGGQIQHTLGAVIRAGSLQFRIGWDPEDFSEAPAFLIRLNPRF